MKDSPQEIDRLLPNDEEVKAHIDKLPYYGACTSEYNEGFEDGVKWLKEYLTRSSQNHPNTKNDKNYS